MENSQNQHMHSAEDLQLSIGHELLMLRNSLHNKIQTSEEKIDAILQEVKSLKHNIFPAIFNEIGFKLSVEQLAQTINESNGLTIVTEIDYKDGTMEERLELILFRIVQEALSNTRKYAFAQSAGINIHQTHAQVKVSIFDNGKGFNFERVMKTGNAPGLLSIIQRCKTLKCTPNFTSNELGTSIQFSIPLTYA